MPKRSSEVTKVMAARGAKLLRALADVVERGEFYDLQIDSMGQYYSFMGEPVRKQHTIRIITEEEAVRG